MKRGYKILRAVFVTLIALAFILPAALYVALSLPAVQQWLCHRAESELSKLLTVDVDIDYISISPFNRVTLHGVTVSDSVGEPCLKVKRLGAGMNLWDYFARDRIVLDYAEIIGMDARISRDSIGAPLNIQPIINALSPKDKSKPPTKFDFRVNTVVIRTSSVSYDVLDQPRVETGFDRNHISISGLRADVQLPQIKNDDFIIDLRRLAFSERSGFALSSLSGLFHIASTYLDVRDFNLQLPNSQFIINDQSMRFKSFDYLKKHWRDLRIDFRLMPGSRLATADFTPFLPQIDGMDMTFSIGLHANGDASRLNIPTLSLVSDQGASFTTAGHISHLFADEGPAFDFPEFDVRFNGRRAMDAASRFGKVKDDVRRIIENAGDLSLSGSFSGSLFNGSLTGQLLSGVGQASLEADYSRVLLASGAFSPMKIAGTASLTDFSGARLMAGLANPVAAIDGLNADLGFDVTLKPGMPDGSAELSLASAIVNGYPINDIELRLNKTGDEVSADLFADNDMLYADAELLAAIGRHKSLDLSADIRDLNLDMIGLGSAGHHGRRLSFTADAMLSGTMVDDLEGTVNIDRLTVSQPHADDLTLDGIRIAAVRSEAADTLTLTSEIADASVIGKFHIAALPAVGKEILAQTLPALSGNVGATGSQSFLSNPANSCELDYDIRIKTLDPLSPLLKLPVRVIDPISVRGDFSSSREAMSLNLDAPYLLQGKKLIENTSLTFGVSGVEGDEGAGRGQLFFSTTLPTKNGPMTLSSTSEAYDDQVDSHLEWKVDRRRDYSGDINLTTRFSRDTDNRLRTELLFNPSRAVFNDTVWTVEPSVISIEGKEICVSDFKVWRDRQFITIDGRASESPADTITVTLEDIDLDYVFETLNIPTAMFGGNASGKLYATQLLTAEPKAITRGLSVKDLTYNYSLMGDALLRSEWVNDSKAISIIAEIHQPNGLKSYVDGEIFPMADSLDMRFDADRIEIGFLKPYMSAFASDISGYATGTARLWGTFKLIDMVGDIYGEDVKLTLGFTNTTYSTTDSVRLTPGRIDISDLTLHDVNGHTAKLNGWVTHKCFKQPEFKFRITDARDLLVYDVKENPEHPWYGRVYGNGSATVSGVPGLVDINVAMTTATGSQFTYVLTDALSAQEYNFITFRDRDQARKDSIAAVNAPPPMVMEIKRQLDAASSGGESSAYRMTFDIDITPQALITLVMDPVGGDRVRTYGSGVLHMFYDSHSEDLEMKGTYTVDRGTYNFTLQDIIIKEFTIEPASSITFNGDPYAAQLNLTAKHQVKANLTDLDESFLEDKELNRTNVPVDAIMHVTGDMRQPEIGFDLDFPTLTEEPKRKVRSIINTEDMMQRQMIYLLALSRFYTPDYMNATRGNELVSVASSTISSQLSSILGQLSDNWNIAPNFRSDRGDFSDVEFDLALSSHLLNNRLLFNGNLGYRDKSLNNNSFIGDFDIEYLLNKSGSLRLKAYNRYNDQNYYLKSALTTQGVGIVFKRDFDNIFSFLRPLLKKKSSAGDSSVIRPDSTSVVPALPAHSSRSVPDDTIPVAAPVLDQTEPESSADWLRIK